MGACTSKSQKANPYSLRETLEAPQVPETPANNAADAGKKSPFFPFYSPSPAHYLFSKKSPAPPSTTAAKSGGSTPGRLFKRPFPPPSPAKHIKSLLLRRHGSVKPNAAAIPEGEEGEGADLDKSFGFSKQFTSRYEIGEEVGRGHFGYTCSATGKKGELKGQRVAVKVIPKSKVSLSTQSLCIYERLKLFLRNCVQFSSQLSYNP